DSSAPVWPAGASLTASAITPHSLTLSWPQATDDVSVVHHHVFQDGVKIATLDAQTTTFSATGLAPWTDYSFTVRAEDQAGNESVMDLNLEVKTTDESSPVWEPGGLAATNITPTSLTLSWPMAVDDAGVASFVLRQDGDVVATIAGVLTGFEVTGLSPWTEYAFTVQALDDAGNPSSDLDVLVSTPDTQSPGWPANATLSVTDLLGTSLTASWTAASDDVAVASYAVLIDGQVVATTTGSVTTVAIDSIAAGTTIWLQVRAYDPAGNISSLLGTTVTMPDMGPPTWDGAVLTAVMTSSDATLSWTQASDDIGVVGYRIYRNDVQVAEVVGTEAIVDGLGHDTEYTFRVEAGDAAGNWSTDGPSVTETTVKAYDPGFQRLTEAQYKNTLLELIVWRYKKTCEALPDTWYCANPQYVTGGPAHIYELRYWQWLFSGPMANYPTDAHITADNEPRGGFLRLDSVVHTSHVKAWVKNTRFKADEFNPWTQWVWEPCQLDLEAEGIELSTWDEKFDWCIDKFITDFGLRAYRRPLTDEEHAELMDVWHEAGESYTPEELGNSSLVSRKFRNVLATMLLSPEFLYRVEVGDENGKLTAYELASRLSYHFWNTMPDDELFAAAADGSLMTEEGYQAQVERLGNDDKAERSINEFYGDFFRVQDLPDLLKQDTPQQYNAGQYFADIPGKDNYWNGQVAGPWWIPSYIEPNWRWANGGGSQKNMTSELLNLGKWFTLDSPGTYEDMFRSNLHLAECHDPNNDASYCVGAGWWHWSYGIEGNCGDYEACALQHWPLSEHGWDGVSEPITLPQPERAGLITRLGFLAHNTQSARPVQRGLKIREMLLCDPIPPPENCDVVKPPQLTGLCDDPAKEPDDATNLVVPCSDDVQCAEGETCKDWDKEISMTVREKVEEITETPGTSCANCHSTFINGFGHALNHFNSVGAYWDKERMYDEAKFGECTVYGYCQPGDFRHFVGDEETWAPIDASGTTLYNGEWVTINGAHELSDFLVDTGQMEWCWSRQYFRFTMGRHEWDSDAESIETMAQTMRDGATLADAYKGIAYLPQFKTLIKPPKEKPKGDTP
ncbi:MAG: fibronectin type III domain-containing protein, partial [Myxococcota bacterium]|nr:fibronectin type III domain-containing protein [Myxococcota bacterium]